MLEFCLLTISINCFFSLMELSAECIEVVLIQLLA